ncbi:hypothetical protein [Micrococcus sp. TA1]|uniref:hypothetical protein n=1 Tax=Micrococcus sp. TA1 TaxID=681627 RepID=UPI00160F7A21|nr:hypothetical protein [Micrococcus sp. TA1]MBB5750341.1 hypothetical protein [Micrococcus sp. TA1]
MGQIGIFLGELSAVEDARAKPLCDCVDFLDREHVQVSTPAGVRTFRLPAARQAIADALHAGCPDDLSSPDPWSADVQERLRHHRWVQLLRDLGQYCGDLASLTRNHPPAKTPWRYQRIERSGATALITVTNGREHHIHTVDLESLTPPSAVPVEIAWAVLAQSVPGPLSDATSSSPWGQLLHRRRTHSRLI